MRLSKVKKIVLDSGTMAVLRANTGIDVQTWIGCDNVMYPVHEIVLTPQLAARIWELTEKQIHQLRIRDDSGNDFSLINPSDLEELPALAEAEGGEQNMKRICQINQWILLKEASTGKGYIINCAHMAPIEGGRVQFFKEEDSNIIAAYSDGKLEAAFYGVRWTNLEGLSERIEEIATMK